MPLQRDASCPLCGAHMHPREILASCSELLDETLGVLAARCPYCQGYLEIRPQLERLEIGYLVGKTEPRFELALTLPWPGLTVEWQADVFHVRAPEGAWHWQA